MLRYLLIIITPFLFVLQFHFKYFVLFYVRVFKDQRISLSAKCPACGCRVLHAIQYSEDYASVIHTCTVCKAAWGEPPVLSVKRWQISRNIPVPKEQE